MQFVHGTKTTNENGGCDMCNNVLMAYNNSRWNELAVQAVAEQCMREGWKDTTPKKLVGEEGCNLSAHFMVNRVGGNFHSPWGRAWMGMGIMCTIFSQRTGSILMPATWCMG